MTSSLKLEEGWLSLLLLLLMIQSAILSVVVASWVDGLGILPWVAIISIVWGFVFARLRFPGIFLHIFSLLVGLAVIVYLVCLTFTEGTLEDRFFEIVTRLATWINVTSAGGIGNDNLLFLLLLASITWLIGYFGSWTVFHSHSGWFVSLAAGTALIINISYAPQSSWFFLVFLVCAILLVARLNFYNLETSWRKGAVEYSNDLGWVLVRTSFLITGLFVSASWLTPSTLLVNQPISEVFVNFSRPWDDIQGEFNRLFGGVRPKGQSTSSNFGKTLPLKTGVKLGGDVVLQVSGTEPRRLRGVVYERYTGQGWLVAERPTYKIAADSDHPGLAPDYKLREDVTQTITIVQPRGNVVFTPSLPKHISIPTTADMELRPSFGLDIGFQEDGQDQPADVQNAAKEISKIVAEQKLSYPAAADTDIEVPQAAVNTVANQLTSSFELLGMRMRSDHVTSVTLRQEDPDFSDVTALHSPSVARKGFRYSVVSSVSVADVESLRKAGDSYPEWIKNRYLPIPRTVTWRTIVLSRRITARSNNPYDSVVAIESYLRGLTYSDQVNLPSSARDAVDYFLFEGKEGYCDYFASAFAILARAKGIPARVVSGFAPGDPDPAQGLTIVRDWHAHTWPEVYFPEYGWIEFEPTPSRPIVSRPETPDPNQSANLTKKTSTGEEDLGDETGIDIQQNESDSGVSLYDLAQNSFDLSSVLEYIGRALLVILVLVGVAYGVLLYFWRRGIEGLSPGEAAFAKLCRLGYWIGIRRRLHQTPNEFAAVISSIVPDQEQNVSMITDAYVRRAFGRKQISVAEERRVNQAWRRLRNALVRVRFNRR